ncbi:MAG: AMP-binding protein [SAR324 cluster bacterium]|nr:AMP-binding protein [SAR324 cluster bacterium]
MLIGDLLRRRARISPGLEFWCEGPRVITYEKLHGDANRVARALLAENLRPGDHIAICSDNSYEYAAVHFGAAIAGLVLAHLSSRLTAHELAQLGAHSDAALMFVGSRQIDAAEQARRALPLVRRWVSLSTTGAGEALPGWCELLDEWLGPHSDQAPDLTRFAVKPEVPAVFPESPFQLLYTSGTTGTPKGVLISHRGKLAHGASHVMNIGLQEGDRLWSALPLYHQFAQWLIFVSVPLAGATVVAAPEFDAGLCWEALRGAGITHLPGVPTMLYRLLDDPASAGAPPPMLRGIVYGGAPMEADRVGALRLCFPGARLFQGFGQTEMGYCLGMLDADHNLRPESLGKPDIFSEVRLLDEGGREMPDNEVGEIVACTPYLMNGYYKDPAATEVFFSYGRDWGRSGDLAVRDEQGFYTLAGRLIDMIITGGMNVYPREVERVLTSHPAVAEAAVFGIPDADWGESVVAAVILQEGNKAVEEELIAHARERLAGFKIPRRVEFHATLPRTHSGKVRKVALRAPYWEQEPSQH